MNTLIKKKKSVAKTGSVKVTKPTHYHVRVLSRHPSVAGLRNAIFVKGAKVVYRHGSTTEGDFEYEINSVDSVKNSADKLKMKECFDNAEVKHAPWMKLIDSKDKAVFTKFLKEAKFPDNMLIIKQRFGSRGTGNYIIRTQKELDDFLKTRAEHLSNYIIERYKNYTVEYRIHVTETGYFYTCRKALRKDTPKHERFQRHDDNCVWLLEENSQFDKPTNWTEIVEDCMKALKSLGADVLAFDVKTTSPKNSKDGKVKWILIESCSAPSFGDVTLERYKIALPDIIKNKYKLESHVKKAV